MVVVTAGLMARGSADPSALKMVAMMDQHLAAMKAAMKDGYWAGPKAG